MDEKENPYLSPSPVEGEHRVQLFSIGDWCFFTVIAAEFIVIVATTLWASEKGAAVWPGIALLVLLVFGSSIYFGTTYELYRRARHEPKE